MKTLTKYGFTLIELLVVMTIISILLGLSTLAFQSSRQAARDTKRKADIEQIRSGLEVYRSDNRIYPASLTPANGLSCGANKVYLPAIGDPISSAYSYLYIGVSNPPNSGNLADCSGNSGYFSYVVCAHLEGVSSSTLTDCSSQSCGTGAPCNYEVQNP